MAMRGRKERVNLKDLKNGAAGKHRLHHVGAIEVVHAVRTSHAPAVGGKALHML